MLFIFLFVGIIGFMCVALIDDISDNIGLFLALCLTVAIAVFGFGPIFASELDCTTTTTTKSYKISKTDNTYYISNSSGDKISVLVKTEDGLKKKSFEEEKVTVLKRNTSPKVKIKRKKVKQSISPISVSGIKKVTIYIPKEENSLNNKHSTNTDIICSYCNTKNDTTSKYCKKCGKELSISINKTICQYCHTENDQDADFCKKCGKSLKSNICKSCHTENDTNAVYCKKCGEKLK